MILEISWIVQKVLDSGIHERMIDTRCNKHMTQHKDDPMAQQLPEHANFEDRLAANALIRRLLKDGMQISINDGCEWVLKKSSDRLEILKTMSQTGEDTVRARNADGERVADFYLIYHNGNKEDPMMTISDYSCNKYADNVWNDLEAKFDKMYGYV